MNLNPTKWQEFVDWVDDIVHRRPDWYWAIKNYKRNFMLFNKLAWNYKSWDSHFSIEVFAKLLEDNARCCKDGLHLNSEKVYRRGMTASGMLRKAYNYSICNDKAYMYIARKYPHTWRDTEGNFTTLRWAGEGNKRVEALRDYASKRCDETERVMKIEAWDYISKYIECLWD